MSKYNRDDLGTLDIATLNKVYRNTGVKAAGLQARNNQRQLNLANIITARNNSASKFKEEFFRNSIQEINTIFWPFMFQSEIKFVEAGQEQSSKITISAEAGFICTHMQRVIYEYDTNSGALTYIDPDDFSKQASDLRYTINDLSSERSFTDKGISLDSMGHCNQPTEFDNPFYINPNQSFEFRFSAEGAKSYFTSILFMGYRVRIQDASLKNIPTVTL